MQAIIGICRRYVPAPLRQRWAAQTACHKEGEWLDLRHAFLLNLVQHFADSGFRAYESYSIRK
jgi:hypothetical protein